LKMQVMTGRFSDLMYLRIKRKLNILLGKLRMMPLVTQVRNALLNQLCLFIETGTRLSLLNICKNKLRRETLRT
jgi:hypothetical protein